MKKIVFLLLALSLFGKEISKENILKMIGNMLIVGFNSQTLPKEIKEDIKKYHLGGVILFDKKGSEIKNIKNPVQLKKLILDIKRSAGYNIFVCIDQEGGLVDRLKAIRFEKFPSAYEIGKFDSISYSKKVYFKLAKELKENNFNCDFAPVVDLAINPKNRVIVKAKRSYGKDFRKVVKHAEIFIKALKEKKIISVLKHFPGHGSSFGDTHKGFVDVSESWEAKELLPYKILISKNLADAVMVAHIYNKKLDPKFIATFSSKIKEDLLRKKLGFRGVIISDDMQMRAISEYYTLKEALKLSINSGTDILLFANQGKKEIKVSKIVKTVYEEIEKGNIKIDKIIKANERIKRLREKIQ